MTWFRWEGETLLLKTRVQPRAPRAGIGDVHGDRLRLRVSSPPVEGKANSEAIALVARAFGVPKSRVRLRRGATSRDKEIEIRAPAQYPAALAPHLVPPPQE